MARKFTFNLEAVLRYRQIMEDQKRRDFAEVSRQLEEEKLREQQIRHERSEMQDEIVRSFQDQAPFQSVVSSYHMVARMENAILECKRRESALEAEMEKRRTALVAARKDTRMMEILKEQRQREFRIEQEKMDQSLLDELSIQDQARKKREGTLPGSVRD